MLAFLVINCELVSSALSSCSSFAEKCREVVSKRARRTGERFQMALRIFDSSLALLRLLSLLAVLDGARATGFCQQVVEPFGYGCTEYSVQTDDGFVLVMHHLSRVDTLMDKGHMESAQPPVDLRNNASGEGQSQSRGASNPGSDPTFSTPNPISSRSPSCNDETTQGATSSASAKPAYPYFSASLGSRQADPQPENCNSLNGTIEEGVHPSISSEPTPAPDTSVSSNRTLEYNSSSVQASDCKREGPATSSTHNAPGSSAPQQTITGSSPSNYTASPEAGKGSPVLLMHMEFLNGDFWFQYVDADRHVSRLLPLMLLEDGFDVWIGHQRATYWGHGHVQLESTDRAYWDWTWDQHVQYDLPAQLRFISTETNQPVHFIGASQAATVGAAAATDKETAQMIRSLTLIGPTAFRGGSNSFLLNAWAYFFGVTLDTRYYTTGFQNGAFNYSSEFPQTGPISGQGLTGLTIGLISGPNCCLGSTSVQFTNGWDGTTSFKNLLHWQQGIRTNTFQRFDYGTMAGNLQAYGRPTPPAYNIAQILSPLPILVIGGGKDWTAPPQGTVSLVSLMQQPAKFVNLTDYAHFDLYFSVHREKDIYLPILQFLEGPEFA